MERKGYFGRLLFAGVVWILALGQNAMADEQDVDTLLKGISGIGAPGLPGPLCVYGPNAFPLVEGGTGNTRAPVVAAGRWEEGRVVALGHDRYFQRATIDTADTGVLLTNALQWAAGEASPRIGVASVRTDIVDVEALRSWLSEADYESAEVVLTSDALASVDVLFVVMWNQTELELDAIREFVRSGGGLVTAATGWGWASLHPHRNLITDYAGNRLLAPIGIQWADYEQIRRTSPSGYAVSGAPRALTHALKALDALEEHDAGRRALTVDETDHAFATLERTVGCLPPNDSLIAPRLRRMLEGASTNWPSADNVVDEYDVTGRLASLYVIEQRRRPAEDVRAHPAAADFPGSVPDDAERITRRLDIDSTVPRWHSTGLYAAPGELITVTAPPAVAEGGDWHVRVGAHTDSLLLWRSEWKRMPEISRRFAVSDATTLAANAFGGLIYIEVPDNADLGTVSIEIEGAVAAPRFVLGETDPAVWRNEIRDAPAPWAEIEGTNMIVTTESSKVRALDDPTDVAETWDRVLDLNAELAAWTEPRKSPERFVVDRQLSIGWMHAGYPLMAHIEGGQSGYIVDARHISTCRQEWTQSNWGFFHEIGHNHQSADWTFQGTMEVTVNLFTLYVYEFLCGVPVAENWRGSPAFRAEQLERYDFDDPDFGQWKNDPFLALVMYEQLQQEFGWEAYRQVFAEYRDLKAADRPTSDNQKRDQWLVRFSRTVGRNLGPFFEAWGVPTSQSARDKVAELPRWLPPQFPPGSPDEDAIYGVNEALPGVPWRGAFTPEALSEGGYATSGTGTTITLDQGGYFELAEGARYTCTSTVSCSIENGAVTAGALTRRAGDAEEEEGIPSFRSASGPGSQTYAVGTAIVPLTLPEANGGSDGLEYDLSPDVPGLVFETESRRLTGTPNAAGTYQMTYTATDADGDSDTLNFTIVVEEDDHGHLMGQPFDLLFGNDDPKGIAYANGRFFVVDGNDNKVYAYSITGHPDTLAEFSLDATNRFPGGITYAEGSLYVVDSLENKVFAYTVAGRRDAAADFELDAENNFPAGIVFASDRFYVVHTTDNTVYAYTVTGQRDASADFELDAENSYPRGIAFVDDRFYVADANTDHVYAYSGSGMRDASAGFDLVPAFLLAEGTVYEDGRFYVVSSTDDKVYAYSAPSEPADAQDPHFSTGDTITELPWGAWFPDAISGGQVTIRSVLTSIELDHGGYIEEGGYRYTCETPVGCEFASREVVSGAIARTSAGLEADTQPSFAGASGVGNPSYRLGMTIDALTLPEATGGNGRLSYSLTPEVPGLTLDPETLRLTGKPTTAGTFEMAYTATDAEGDIDTLNFTIAVEESGEGACAAEPFGLQDGNGNSSGIVCANDRFYVVDNVDAKTYAYANAGERDPSGDFELAAGNGSPDGIAYAVGHFYVIDSDDKKVYAYTGTGQRDASADFDLDSENSNPGGITYAEDRLFIIGSGDKKVYAHSLNGQRNPEADFNLQENNGNPVGLAWDGGRFYVVDSDDKKVYAYRLEGQRDPAVDFDLQVDNGSPTGIAFAGGSFLVVDDEDDWVYGYATAVQADEPQGPDTGFRASGSLTDAHPLSLQSGTINGSANGLLMDAIPNNRANDPDIDTDGDGEADGGDLFPSDNKKSDLYYFRIQGSAIGLTGTDFDGDGLEDLVVKGERGVTYLVSSHDLKYMDGADGITDRVVDFDEESVPANSWKLGGVRHDRVFPAGDVDFDGKGDLIINNLLVSAFTLRAGTGGVDTADGRAWQFSADSIGRDGGVWQLVGSQSDPSVFSAIDFNADGGADLLIGAPARKGEIGPSSDVVYVSSGVDWRSADALDGAIDGRISLEEIAAHSRSWRIVSDLRIALGTSISPAGDVNGDGSIDLMIGAPEMPFEAKPDSGVLIVLSGAAMVSLDAADGETDGVIRFTQGPQEGAWKLGGNDFKIGTSVSAAGDTDGDGLDDLLVTANSGVYLVTGASLMATPSGGDMAATGTRRFAWMDNGLGVGDVDSDGLSDVLLLDYRNAFLISGIDLPGLGEANGVVNFETDTVPNHSWRLGFRDPNIRFQGSASMADLNGDGFPELILPVTARGEETSYIISLSELSLFDAQDGRIDRVIHLDDIAQ